MPLDPKSFLEMDRSEQKITLSHADPKFEQLMGTDAAAADAQLDRVLQGVKGMLPKQPAQRPPNMQAAPRRWLQAANDFLAKARAGTSERQGPIAGTILGDVVNPVPGDLPSAVGMAATLPIKGTGGLVQGLAKRVLAGGGAAGATKFAMTGDPKEALKEAGEFGAGQAFGEVATGVPARLMRNRGMLTEARQTRADKIAYDEAFTKALDFVEKRQYEEEAQKYQRNLGQQKRQYAETAQQYDRDLVKKKQAHEAATTAREALAGKVTAEHAERGASIVADAFGGETIPAWEGLPSGTRGLLERYSGKGQALLSEAYDRSLKEVIRSGTGQRVQVPVEVADTLNVPIKGRTESSKSRVTPGEDRVEVDAGDLARKMTGRWKDHRRAYKVAAQVLDEADIGDPNARAQYKAGQALISFIDKTKALEGDRFHPDRVLKGLTSSVKTVNELRHREQGDVFRGPFAEAARLPLDLPPEVPPFQAPPKPQPPIPGPKPQAPIPRVPPAPPPEPEGFKTRTVPGGKHPYLAGLGAGAAAYGAISGNPKAMAAGAIESAIMGSMGREFVTLAPTQKKEILYNIFSAITGQAAGHAGEALGLGR